MSGKAAPKFSGPSKEAGSECTPKPRIRARPAPQHPHAHIPTHRAHGHSTCRRQSNARSSGKVQRRRGLATSCSRTVNAAAQKAQKAANRQTMGRVRASKGRHEGCRLCARSRQHSRHTHSGGHTRGRTNWAHRTEPREEFGLGGRGGAAAGADERRKRRRGAPRMPCLRRQGKEERQRR